MSITTQRGDHGETELMFGRRVSKLDPLVVAVGEVDELNAALGLARSFSRQERVTAWIAARQQELVGVMGELATAEGDRERYILAGYARVTPEAVAAFTAEVKALEDELDTRFAGWATPGADTSPCAAALDLARTICRRAERAVVGAGPANPELLRHLNRLSDFLWLLARYETRACSSRKPAPLEGGTALPAACPASAKPASAMDSPHADRGQAESTTLPS